MSIEDLVLAGAIMLCFIAIMIPFAVAYAIVALQDWLRERRQKRNQKALEDATEAAMKAAGILFAHEVTMTQFGKPGRTIRSKVIATVSVVPAEPAPELHVEPRDDGAVL